MYINAHIFYDKYIIIKNTCVRQFMIFKNKHLLVCCRHNIIIIYIYMNMIIVNL